MQLPKPITFFVDFVKFSTVPALVIIMFLFMIYMSNYSYVFLHEEVHSSIFESYGINESDIEIVIDKYTLEGYTYVNGTNYQTYCQNTDCKMLQQMNEIVGYNTGAIIGSISGFGLIIVFTLLLIFIKLRDLIYTNVKLYEVNTKLYNVINEAHNG